MSLKLRRNLPLVLLLLGILTFLMLVLGNQPIIAYTATREGQAAEPTAAIESDVTNDVGGTAGPLETLGADAGSLSQ